MFAYVPHARLLDTYFTKICTDVHDGEFVVSALQFEVKVRNALRDGFLPCKMLAVRVNNFTLHQGKTVEEGDMLHEEGYLF